MYARASIFFLILFSMLVDSANAQGAVAPDLLHGTTVVDARWVKKTLDSREELMIIDARIVDEYDEGHLPGAFNIYADVIAANRQLLPKDKNHPILFYCNGPKCLKSHESAKQALEWGYTKVYWFRGGIPEWNNHGYPLE